jgi:lysophospholipase L1-like esterase
MRRVYWCAAAILAFMILMSGPAWAGWRITCIGDSITENHIPWRLERMLEAATGEDWTVRDRGRGGYTTGDLRAVTAAAGWAGDGSKLAFVMAGTNDAVFDRRPSSSAGNIRDIVRRMRRGGASVVVAWIIPSTTRGLSSWAYEYNLLLDTESDADYILRDTWAQFYNPDAGTARGELMDDYLHPNSDGYDLLAEAYFKVAYSLYQDPFTDKVDPYAR